MLFALLCVFGALSEREKQFLAIGTYGIVKHNNIARMYKLIFNNPDFKPNTLLSSQLEPTWPVNVLFYAAEWIEDKNRTPKDVNRVCTNIFEAFKQMGQYFTQNGVYYDIMIQLYENVKTASVVIPQLLRDFAATFFVYRNAFKKEQILSINRLFSDYGFENEASHYTSQLQLVNLGDDFADHFKQSSITRWYPEYFSAARLCGSTDYRFVDYTKSMIYLPKFYKNVYDSNYHYTKVVHAEPAWMVNALYYLGKYNNELGNQYKYSDLILRKLASYDRSFTQNGVYTGIMSEMFDKLSEKRGWFQFRKRPLILQLLIDFAFTFFAYRPNSYDKQVDAITRITDKYGMQGIAEKWIELLSTSFYDPYISRFTSEFVNSFYPKEFRGVQLLNGNPQMTAKSLSVSKIDVEKRYIRFLSEAKIETENFITLEALSPANSLRACAKYIASKVELKQKIESSNLEHDEIYNLEHDIEKCSIVIDSFKDLDYMFTQNGVYYKIMRLIFDKVK
eukprot:NODE_371_length_8592_cov_0.668904.p3 type:complete len:506 gc:universal NODE_371_length_8592_cov_0.668904:6285-7802(+)